MKCNSLLPISKELCCFFLYREHSPTLYMSYNATITVACQKKPQNTADQIQLLHKASLKASFSVHLSKFCYLLSSYFEYCLGISVSLFCVQSFQT